MGTRRRAALKTAVAGTVVALAACIPVSTDTTGDAEQVRDVGGLIWQRVAHDEQVFGGPDHQSILSVVAFGGGLVAVGSDWSDPVVWRSDDGDTWTRVAHDEQVFSGRDNRWMWSVTAFDGGLVAAGFEGPGSDRDAAVWLAHFEG